jgi:serine/threonine-protein kinase
MAHDEARREGDAMNLERWHEVDRLFAEVLDRPPAERTAFLDEACAGDTALRQEVERLLAADAEGSRFLAGPPDELLGLALEDREEGGSLGPYRLLRKIGSGGMGTVYLARREDEHYERDVAIKVLRSGLASTEVYHRFLAERQILARLEHPNIARLYDGGSTEEGRPYLVMELISGVPVDAYCDQHRLTLDQRLALFQKICSAVAYAHQNLLVHRDLKPANILVTAEGEPKLLDFGIAKRLAPETDGPHETQTRMRMLTPSYASPEQVKGEAITTASDVYSLGVILYELLTGRRPHRIASEAPYEIERAVCEEEPERPSAALFRPEPPDAEEIARARRTRPRPLARRLRGDLDNIVLMALRKEPHRRYGAVSQLARDLERHLQNRPVLAQPDTLRYRTRKLLRRHRTAAVAAAVIVALAAGFVASLIAQGRQLARERDKARYALSFLVDTFKQADPYHTRGERLTAREILDQGADRIARELAGEPDVQAAVMDAIGEVDLGLGRYDAAEHLLKNALALRRRVFGSGALETAESLEHLAALRNERFDFAGAETLLREALPIRRRRQGDGDLAVARTLNALGQALAEQGVSPGNTPRIEALHREALAIARRIEQPEGLTVAETLLALADLQRALGNYAEAERLFAEGLAVERKALGDRDPRFWRDRSRFGDTLVEAGKLREGEAVFRQCLTVQRRLLGREHPDAENTQRGLAVAIHLQGRYTESEALDRELLAMARAQYGPTHWRVGETLCNLAADLVGQARRAEAVPLYEEALEIRRQILGEKHWQVAQILLLLAEIRRSDKDYPQALALARQAYEAFAAGEGPDHPYAAHALLEIGRDYLDQNRFAEAEPVLRRCLEIRQKRLEALHPDLAMAQVVLAKCLIGEGRLEEAAGLLREARSTRVARFGPDHEAVRSVDSLLAEIKKRRGKP